MKRLVCHIFAVLAFFDVLTIEMSRVLCICMDTD